LNLAYLGTVVSYLLDLEIEIDIHDIPLLISHTIFYSIRCEYPLLLERMIDKSV
jgi:hypothetical protein